MIAFAAWPRVTGVVSSVAASPDRAIFLATRCTRPCWCKQSASNPPRPRLQERCACLPLSPHTSADNHAATSDNSPPRENTNRNPAWPLEFVRFADIARNAFEIHTREPAQITLRPQQRFHAMPPRNQFMHEVCANKPRSAGDETFIHWRVESWSPGVNFLVARAFYPCEPKLTGKMSVPPLVPL